MLDLTVGKALAEDVTASGLWDVTVALLHVSTERGISGRQA